MAGMAEVNKIYVEGARILQNPVLLQSRDTECQEHDKYAHSRIACSQTALRRTACCRRCCGVSSAEADDPGAACTTHSYRKLVCRSPVATVQSLLPIVPVPDGSASQVV
jgi:hypothetical protein